MPDISAFSKAQLKLIAAIVGEFVGTTDAQTLASKTLTTPVLNGTVTTTGLTLPTFTMGGHLNIGGFNIIQALTYYLKGTDGSDVKVMIGANTLPQQDVHFFSDHTKQVGSTGDSLYFGFNSDWKIVSFYSHDSGVNTELFTIDSGAGGFIKPKGTVQIGPNSRLQLSETNLTAQRAFTFPDSAGVVLVDTATQTQSNKTMTTPVVNGVKYADVAKTANYTLTLTDTVIRADASAGAFTLTLPAASGNTGLRYVIIRTDVALSTNLLTIAPNGAELINSNTKYILFPGESIIIECDGTGWQVLSQAHPSVQGYSFNKGATANRRYIAGLNTNMTLLTATTGPTVNTLYAIPFFVTNTTKFDTIECEVTTLGSGSNLRLGIYRDNGNCYPGALIFDSGNISSATTGAKSATITSALQVFNPDLYWLTYENSATVPLIRILPGAGSCIPILGNASPFGANNSGIAYTVAHTVGALPDPYTAGATIVTTPSAAATPIPAVALRAV